MAHVNDDLIQASVLDHGPALPAQPQPRLTPTRWPFAAADCGCCAGWWMRSRLERVQLGTRFTLRRELGPPAPLAR